LLFSGSLLAYLLWIGVFETKLWPGCHLGSLLHFDGTIHLTAGGKGGKPTANVCIFQPSFMLSLTRPRLLGGALMVAVGLVYLLFEKSITAQGAVSRKGNLKNGFSRGILGAQVERLYSSYSAIANFSRSVLSS
jgi:hypothetical protein